MVGGIQAALTLAVDCGRVTLVLFRTRAPILYSAPL
jgi:hypothetical protein